MAAVSTPSPVATPVLAPEQGANAVTRLAELTGAASQAARPLELSGRVVLLATDGSAESHGAARAAHEIAARHHAVIRVVHVIDTRPAPIPPPLDLALAIGDAVVDPALHQQQAEDVRVDLAAATGHDVDWPVRVMLGTPANAIAQEARRTGAALVLVGLRRHNRAERVLGDETALNVMRHAPCPVLGVAAGAPALPKRVLAALDFTRSSLLAMRTARTLAGDGATMVLAYVPPLTIAAAEDGERLIHELGVQAGFAQAAAALRAEGVSVDHVVLHHERPCPVGELLLEYAETARIDLVAAGSARHGRVDRWLMGSVSTDLVRDGRRSVLVVPPPDREPG